MGEFIGLVAVLCVFGLPAAVILGSIWMRERTKQSAHKLISEALARGQTIDPALLTQLAEMRGRPADRARRTLGSGVVLLALAGGFAGASALRGGFDPGGFADEGMLTAALILGALGLAFTILGVFDYATKKKTEQ
jgi:hypothetical protein